MSDRFYRGLSVTCKNDVRLVDKLKIHIVDEDFENDDPYAFDESNELDVYTYDLDAEAVYRNIENIIGPDVDDDISLGSRSFYRSSTRRIERSNSKTSFGTRGTSPNLLKRRASMKLFSSLNQDKGLRIGDVLSEDNEGTQMRARRIKVLPTEPIKYNVSVFYEEYLNIKN